MRVTIAFDEQFGEDGDIPAGEAYWLIDSPANRALAGRLRSSGGRDPNSAVFKWPSDEDPTQALLGLLDTVELHHPEMSEAIIFGYSPTSAFESAIRPYTMKIEGDRVVIRPPIA